eukprot:4393973-Amphidinium_carterae.2
MPPPPVPDRRLPLRRIKAADKANATAEVPKAKAADNTLPIPDDDTDLVEVVPYRPMPKQRIVLKEKATPDRKPPPPKAQVNPGTTQDIWRPCANDWLASEDSQCGTFKVSAPRVATLGEFARTTIAPLASLMCVKVCLLSRRGLDQQVRVSYVRDLTPRIPVVTPSIEEFADLRAECEVVSHFCPMSYIQFTIAAPQIEYILNYWTQLGRECQANLVMVLRGALWYARENARTTCPSAGVLLFQAHTLVIIARPLTCHSLLQQQTEIEGYMSTFLRRNAVRAEGQEWQISLSSMVRGGQQAPTGMQHGAHSLYSLSSLSAGEKIAANLPCSAYSLSARPTPRQVANILFDEINDLHGVGINNALHMVTGGMHGQGGHLSPTSEEPIPYGLLTNPDALADMIETFYEDEPIASPRPRGRDIAELELDDYDEPWVALHLRTIYDMLVQHKPSLSTWKQMSRSLPSMAPPVDALEGHHIRHRVLNTDALERLLNAHRAEQALQPPVTPIAPRNVWSHLTDFERRWTQYNLDVLRRQIVAQLHAIPPNLWWRYFGRSPEDDPEAIAQGGGAKRSTSPASSSLPVRKKPTYSQPEQETDPNGITCRRQKQCNTLIDDFMYMGDMKVRLSEIAKEYIDQTVRSNLATQKEAYPESVLVARVPSSCSTHLPHVHMSITQLFFHGKETLKQASLFFARRLRTSPDSIHLSVRHFEFHDDRFSAPYCRRSYSAHHDEPPPHAPLWNFENLYLMVDDTCTQERRTHPDQLASKGCKVCADPEHRSDSCIVKGGGKCWSVHDSPSGTHEKLRQKDPVQQEQGAPFRYMHLPTSPSMTGTQYASQRCSAESDSADSSDSTPLSRDVNLPVHRGYFEETFTDNHVRAFCNAASTLRMDLSLQGAVWALEEFVRAQTVLGRAGSLLTKELEKVCHIPPEQWSGTGAPQLFFKGAIFDLAVLSMLFRIGITLVDDNGNYPLQTLQPHGSPWAMLRVSMKDYAYAADMVALPDGLVCNHIKCDLEQCDPVWDNRTQGIIFDLLAQQLPPVQPVAEETTQSRVSGGHTISSTEPMVQSVRTDQAHSQVHSSPAHTAFRLAIGAGRGSASSSSAPQSRNAQLLLDEQEDQEDLMPLTQLLSSPDDPQAAINQPMIVFEGKFHNGRTLYSQVLWSSMNWRAAQLELNRDVRRKLVLWCLCVDGVPVDPLEMVPSAHSPFDRIVGSLRRLTQPLDYQQLRVTGGLCSPRFPTYTGRNGVPFAEAFPELCARPLIRLVEAVYDSDSDMPEQTLAVVEQDAGETPDTIGSSTSTSQSSSSSIYVLTDADTDSDDVHCMVDDSPISSSSLEIVIGGGKLRRVQHESIAKVAVERMIIDLGQTPQGLLIEHRCVTHLLHADAHAAKAIFQSQTIGQRYRAFAAALARAGLTDFSNGITVAAASLGGIPSGAKDDSLAQSSSIDMTQQQATVDPYMQAPFKKRGRPKREEGASKVPNTPQGLQASTAASAETDMDLFALMTKVAQIEKWAHGVDCTLARAHHSEDAKVNYKTTEHGLQMFIDGTNCWNEDVPPTIDFDQPTTQEATVPQRIANYEKLIQERRDAGELQASLKTRLVALEETVHGLASQLKSSSSASQRITQDGETSIQGEQTAQMINQLDKFAIAASQQLQKLRVFPVGVPLPPEIVNDNEAEGHLGWRLHMLEKTMHEHVEAAQSLQSKMGSDLKAEQTRCLRLQTECDNLKKLCQKHDQLFAVMGPWMSNISSRVQDSTQTIPSITQLTSAMPTLPNHAAHAAMAQMTYPFCNQLGAGMPIAQFHPQCAFGQPVPLWPATAVPSRLPNH